MSRSAARFIQSAKRMSPGSPRRVSDTELAHFEGSLPHSWFARPGFAHHVPAIQRYCTLRDLLQISRLIPPSAGRWVGVRKVDHLDALWLSKTAERFVALLAMVVHDVEQRNSGRVLHPRLAVVFAHASEFLNLRQAPYAQLERLRSNPQATTELLSEVLPEIRRTLDSRSHIVRELRYDEQQAQQLARLKDSFKAVAKSYPGAVVLRIEVFAGSDPADRLARDWAARQLDRAFRRWKLQIKHKFVDGLVSFESRLQWDESHSLGRHAVVVLNGPPVSSVLDLQAELGRMWMEIVGSAGGVLPCKTPQTAIYCRGRQLGANGDSLVAELSDAALYLVKGGGLIEPKAPSQSIR